MTDLSSIFGKEKSAIDVLLGLLTQENIENKTDLSETQIAEAIKIKWLEAINDRPTDYPLTVFNEEVIPYFFNLLVSKNRQSRKEIIEGLSKMKDEFLEMMSVKDSITGSKR